MAWFLYPLKLAWARKESLSSLCLVLAFHVGVTLVVLTSRLNRSLSGPVYYESLAVVQKCWSTSKGHIRWWLVVRTERGRESIDASGDVWKRVSAGEPVRVALRSGFLGYPVVVDVQPAK